MENNLKKNKASDFERDAKKLIGNKRYRSAILLYWSAIRDVVFSKLEAEGIAYKSTDEAMKSFIVNNDDEIGNKVHKAYTFGTMAGWDEHFDFAKNEEVAKKNG